MDYVDEQYTPAGVKALDASRLVVKNIATLRINYGSSGSIQVPEWGMNGQQPFVAVLAIEGSNSSYQPEITIAGTTLSWVTSTAPYMGTPAAVDLNYGYY